MTQSYIITGTDTGIGKTVCAAMLTLALGLRYWKPLQSGTVDGTDTETVRKMTQLPADRFLPETHILTQPLSPHYAAELDGVGINPQALTPPCSGLVIEGAGGLMVPVTRDTLQIDIFKTWCLPVILCARTGLGTLNHTLLSVESLRARGMPVHGIVFIGTEHADNIRTIAEFSGIKILGRIPPLETLSPQSLRDAFDTNFRAEDFS